MTTATGYRSGIDSFLVARRWSLISQRSGKALCVTSTVALPLVRDFVGKPIGERHRRADKAHGTRADAAIDVAGGD
jgi:hypothetical protein